MNPISENKTFIDEAINSSEFTELIDKAAPYRVKIDTDYRREMKEVKDMFLTQMFKSDPKLQLIVAKKKKDRSEDEIEYYNTAIKSFNRKFNAVKKIIHPNKGDASEAAQKLVDRIVEVAEMLKYIGRDYITDAFKNVGIKIDIPDLEDKNQYFAKNGTKDVVADIFDQADEVQGCICQASDEIKINIFNELPDNIKFDAKQNRRGIKPGGFQKLVKSKALILEGGEGKASKFKENFIRQTENFIVTKQIEAEKTKTI